MAAHVQRQPAAQGYTALRGYRYERKFLVDDLQPCQVQSLIRLHPRLFYLAYPPRWVNNLYFDTPELQNYYDNLYGADHRRKVRLRWYGAPVGWLAQPMLEIKVKRGLVGAKHSYPFPAFELAKGFSTAGFRTLLDHAGLPENVNRNLECLELVLFNRYSRAYYASRDGCFRLTLDSQVTYYRAHDTPGITFLHHQSDVRNLVVELKYETHQEPQADRVAGYFPFRMARNSKYVQGIERVYF